jgi:acetyltransferase EpsM
MKNNIWIYGAGGMGKETLWLLKDCSNDFAVKGFVDDYKFEADYENLPIIKEPSSDDFIIIAIANTAQRKDIVKNKFGLNFSSIIHPNVKINSTIQTGLGNIFCYGVIFTTNIKIGNHVIININSIIGHDAIIEDFVSIMFDVKISGNVTIGEGTYIGSGAIILPNLKIGKWCKIGAGSVVTKDVPDGATFLGIPAKERL